MRGSEEMRALVRRHIRLWKTANHAEWRACFSPGYSIEDPVGTGARPMGSYEVEWRNMHTDALRLDMEIYRLTVGGREVVADLRAVTHLGLKGSGPDSVIGTRHTISYTGIYRIDEEGLLCSNRTFADPVPDELWAAFYPTLPLPSELPAPARSDSEIRQAVEDHLYFWNVGNRENWRRRFSEDAWVEDPVGTGPRQLGDAGSFWRSSHTENRRVTLGVNRLIVCGMEALAHAVSFVEEEGRGARSSSTTEIFSFDDEGYITSWRVFRDD